MQKKKMLQEFLGHRFLVFALFMLIFSCGLKAAEEEYQKKKISVDRKSTRLNSSHPSRSRMPSSA